jgi:hypothetical protein
MNIFILISSFIVLFFSIKLYKIASGFVIFKINLINFSFWMLLIIAFIPSLLITIGNTSLWGGGDDVYQYIGRNSKTHFIAFISILWSFIAIPISIIITDKMFLKNNSSNYLKFKKINSFDFGYGYNEKEAFSFILIFSFIFSYFFYSNAISNAPILNLINGSIGDMLIDRREFNLGTNNGILKTIFNEEVIKLYMIFSLLCYYKTSKTKWKILFLILFVNLIILNLSKGSLGPLLFLILSILFTRALVIGKFIKITELVLFIFVLSILFIYIKGADGNILQVITGPILGRFSSQILGFYYSLNFFPYGHDFLYFSSTGAEIHKLFGYAISDSYGILMMKDYSIYGVENSGSGHFSSIFLAEAWANFGYIGLIVAPIIVGIFLSIIQIVFTFLKFNLFNLALFVHIAISIPYDKDFVSFYYPLGFIIFSFGYLFLIILSQLVKKFFTKSLIIT